MKTSELTGAALDWAVAKCEDLSGATSGAMVVYRPEGSDCYHEYTPSTDWSHGGPIIERELIALCLDDDGDTWRAWYPMRQGIEDGTGPTPLIAAMRCYVAGKLGDTIEVPEGL